jgi:hypothetical protein
LEVPRTSVGCQKINTQIEAPGVPQWGLFYGSSSTSFSNALKAALTFVQHGVLDSRPFGGTRSSRETDFQ